MGAKPIVLRESFQEEKILAHEELEFWVSFRMKSELGIAIYEGF